MLVTAAVLITCPSQTECKRGMRSPLLIEELPATRNRTCTALTQVCKYLRFSGVSVPQEYEVGFQRALWTFRYFFRLLACLHAVLPLLPVYCLQKVCSEVMSFSSDK